MPDLTLEEFEHGYAERSGVTIAWLHEQGMSGRPCGCGWENCEGWQMVRSDTPIFPWERHLYTADLTAPLTELREALEPTCLGTVWLDDKETTDGSKVHNERCCQGTGVDPKYAALYELVVGPCQGCDIDSEGEHYLDCSGKQLESDYWNAAPEGALAGALGFACDEYIRHQNIMGDKEAESWLYASSAAGQHNDAAALEAVTKAVKDPQ